MKTPPYFFYFRGYGDVKKHSNQSLIYPYFKHLFMDNRYKWKVRKFKSFINDQNLDYQTCVKVLEDFSHIDNSKTKSNRKGFIEFIEKIKKRASKVDANSRVKLKIKKDKEKFIVEYTNLLYGYSNLNKIEIFTRIFETFDIGFSKNYIKYLYNYHNDIRVKK